MFVGSCCSIYMTQRKVGNCWSCSSFHEEKHVNLLSTENKDVLYYSGILEVSRQCLNEGQALMDEIRHISMSAMGDARGQDHHQQSVRMACSAIEYQLEELNDRRRSIVDILLIKRKKLLEECLQLCLLQQEIDQVGYGFHYFDYEELRHQNQLHVKVKKG